MYSGYEQAFFNDRLRGYVTRTTGRGFQGYPTVWSMNSQFQLPSLLSAPRKVLYTNGAPANIANLDGSFKPIVGWDSPPSI